MKKIDRRSFLKSSLLLGSGIFAIGFPPSNVNRRGYSYFLVTDNPRQDVHHLQKISDLGVNVIESSPIQPSGQDLTIIENGKLIDPLHAEYLSNEMKNFTLDLRSRKTAGSYLVYVDSFLKQIRNLIIFEVDGRIIERVNPKKNYKQIVILGNQGKTVFSLQSAGLSAIEVSCRNKLCQRMGTIHSGRIICAPNKLVASINLENTFLDGITG